MLRLSPPDKLGEFFGLYGLAGKFSAVTAPSCTAIIVSTLLNAGWGRAPTRWAIFSFLILMSSGSSCCRSVPDRLSEPAAA